MTKEVPTPLMTRAGSSPTDAEVAEWIGEGAYRCWQRVTGLIESQYPGVLSPEWLYGGKKHGWSLRYKKNRPLCTLVPEEGRFKLLLVFGGEERAKVETMRESLSERTLREYDAATTYHDGKWVPLTVDSEEVVQDIVRLWATKRRPTGLTLTEEGQARAGS